MSFKGNTSDPSIGILACLRRLPKKDGSTIRIFDVDGVFRAYQEDAEYVAQTVHRTTSVLKYAQNNTPWCSMNYTIFGTFVKDALLNRGLKLEIYTKNGSDWSLAKQASPGNIQAVESLVGGAIDQNPVVCAVKLASAASKVSVGVCFVDANARKIGITEFEDNELLSNLESLVIQLGVKECLVPEDKSDKDYNLAKVRGIMDRCSVLVTQKPGNDFAGKDIDQDLDRLVRKDEGDEAAPSVSVSMLPELSNKTIGLGSAAALIKYLGLMSSNEDVGNYSIIQHDLSQYMRLDSSALKALNLLPDPRTMGSKTMSLSGLLNQCKSAPGSRLLEQWLKQPLVDKDKIEARHLLVEALVNDSVLRHTLQEDLLKAVPDINRIVRKFQRGFARLEDVVRVYQLVIKLPDFINALESIEDASTYKDAIESTYLVQLRDYLASLENLQELVETTVDLDALDNHEFIIKPDFDSSLQTIRSDLEDLKEAINQEHVKAADDLGLDAEKKLKLEEHKVYGHCMRVTRNEAGVLKTKSGYYELGTQKNGVYFATSAMKKLSSAFREKEKSYNSTQSGLVKEVVSIAATYCPVLETLSAVIAHLDVIVSFAHVSATAPEPYVRPTMHPRHTGNTILKEARHPCMEAQEDVTFIPNDVELRRGESEFLVITGPNMGGKSTYIRQVGVIALMAQAGCFVPCAVAELTIFDSILARVGAGDSQLKGVSTFMAEMLETATILKTATRESLIVIDELGRGTSTYDGFGLAWAISDHIINHIGCFSMFATHFHELTALADSHKGVKNLHVVAHVEQDDDTEAQDNDITLLYKVEPGVSDKSFGINVAEAVRFPQKVINMAKRKASELDDIGEDDKDQIAKVTKKYSKEDIHRGSERLRDVLKAWRSNVSLQEEGPQEAVAKLRQLVEGEYKDVTTNPFIQELMATL